MSHFKAPRLTGSTPFQSSGAALFFCGVDHNDGDEDSGDDGEWR